MGPRRARVVDPGLAAESLAAGSSTLIQREREVLTAVATGATVRDIAKACTFPTERYETIYRRRSAKAGARTSPEAAGIAESNGWL